MLKNILLLFITLFILLISTEIILRIYNPFPFRVKGDKIILPVNQKYKIENHDITGLDSVIIHSKNSLGFRGQELPKNFNEYLSIIAVGGSTTECFFISDKKDWPNLLYKNLKVPNKKIWINNAGLDGHTTFGHLVLLTDYISKIYPKYVLYFIGCNDVGRDNLNSFDKHEIYANNLSLKDWIVKNSEFVGLLKNLYRNWLALNSNLGHKRINLKEIPHIIIDSLKIKYELKKHEKYLPDFEKRLLKLVNQTKSYGIIPILITQPTLFGDVKDSLTGINLGTLKYMNDYGSLAWYEILEMYNDETRKVAIEQNIHLIDLSMEMPKNSLYFYDEVHFTNLGSELVSKIVANNLNEFLN
jgi:lysophospholipase L1-like esterase